MAKNTVTITASVSPKTAQCARKRAVLTDRGNFSALVERALLFFESAQSRKESKRIAMKEAA